MTDSRSDAEIMEEILKNPNHIAAIDLKAAFTISANPFNVVVTKTPAGTYKAIETNIVKKGTFIDGIDDILSGQWLGQEGETYRQQIEDHLNQGGYFAFTSGGAEIGKATQSALNLADNFNTAVMFMHNDSINIAEPGALETVSIKLPGYYKS